MTYVWYYSAVSFAFLAVTAVYYHIQRRIPDMPDHLYSIMLISCTAAAFFEAFSSAIMPWQESWPVWSLYLFHMMFLVSLQTCLPTCVKYMRAVAGALPKQRWNWQSLMLIPYYVVLALIAISPLCRYGIFYIAEDHSYCYGATHSALFIVTAIYFAMGFVTMFRHRAQLSKRDTRLLVMFCLLIMLTIVIQLFYPSYLLTVTVVGIAITALFHSMQSQSNYIDAVTDVFDRFAMDKLLTYEYSRQRDFSAVIYSLENFELVGHTLGAEYGNALLRQFAQYLAARYPKQSVIRISADQFAVLTAEETSSPEAPPRIWETGGARVELTVHIAVARSADFPRQEDMAAVLDYLLEDIDARAELSVADGNMLSLARRAGESAAAIARALDNGGFGISMQPLYHGGEVWGQEIQPASDDPALFGVAAAELIELAVESGNAARLCEAMLRGGCERLRALEGSPETPERICVFMPLALYMREGASERIAALVAGYGVEPRRICFQLSEYLPDEELSAARENVSALMKLGFGVLLEHFGAGSAGFNTLVNLSGICVRLDSELLQGALYTPVRRRMISGIYSILEELAVPVVYGDPETERQSEQIGRLGSR